MEIECLRPNGSTFTSLLQASSFLEYRFTGSTLHSKVIKFGFLNDVCVQTSLLGMYSNCVDLGSANEVFRDIGDKDSVAWNSVISGHFKNDKMEEGLRIFESMVRTGSIPTQFTYSMVFNACGRLGDFTCGRIIHAQVIISGIPTDLPLHNAMLDMYCNCGNTQTAFRVFSEIGNPDLASWNSMISGYFNNGDGKKAIDLYIQFGRESNIKPDEYTYAAIISGTGALPAREYGKPLHAQVKKAGFEMSVYVGSTLVSMYFKNDKGDSAQKVFCLVPNKDAVLWTEMITGHSRIDDRESALHFFYGMCQEGYKIDSFSLSGALSACADLAILKQGEMIHSQAIKIGYDVEMSVSGSLIDMYAKNGNLEAAQSIFSGVADPDLKCWNSMLGGHSHHGNADSALKLFDQFIAHGLKPDQVTFISLLSSCSHCGLVERGKKLWNCMKEHDMVPGLKHYSCMVSLLSRVGLLEEAEELINESPFNEHNLELWRSLLSSCVVHRNLKIGVHAAEQVLRLNPEDSATHILLSNLYAATGRWDGVTKMRRKMRGMMLEKDPGLSWFEATNNIHVFSSGDQSHPMIDEAQAELHRLQGNMIRDED